MGSNLKNLMFRFLLEVVALIALGAWGWQSGEGVIAYVGAIGIPLMAAAAWGTFAVPDDPSRSGNAPVPVSGLIRLLLELAFFGLATRALFAIGRPEMSLSMGIAVVVHYALSYDRIRWLVRPRGG